MKPEEKARVTIDEQLTASGWLVTRDKSAWQSGAAVAIAEWVFPSGIQADYLLFFKGKAIAIVEAKPQKMLIGGVYHQADGYANALDAHFPAWMTPIPFIYVANGAIVLFADRRDKYSRQRIVFSFHQPETLEKWVREGESTLQNRLLTLSSEPMPAGLNLRLCQIEAIGKLEESFAQQKRRAYVHLATGAGKTFTACTFCYRLIRHARAKRILFLVDRGNLGQQAHDSFSQWPIPEYDRKFTDEYSVVRLSSGAIEGNPRVVISTIQRIYSILTHSPMSAADDEVSVEDTDEVKQVVYNSALPPEFFDFIVVDECHRSIYKNWKQVLEYFDSTIIGLTATPTDVTAEFFEKNKVAEYTYEQSVKDGVNVGYCVYRIKTHKSEHGGVLTAAGDFPAFRKDLLTQKIEDPELKQDITYDAGELNRFVESEPQVRTILQAYKDAIYRDLYPERKRDDAEFNINYIPKTLIFAQSDAHAELITRVAQEVFGRGDAFCKKVTYSVTGTDTKSLVNSFRTDAKFRIAVTVDMIATGTDVRPLEVVLFMRDVKSATYYQQMYGRGCRTIADNMLQNVTPNASSKDFFYLVDAVGVTEHAMVTSAPQLPKPPTKPLDELMELAYKGELEDDEWKTLGYRLNRIVLKSNRLGYADELDAIIFHESAQSAEGDLHAAEGDGFGLYTLAMRLREGANERCAHCFSPLHREQIITLYRKQAMWLDPTPDTVEGVGFSQEIARELTAGFMVWVENNQHKIKALELIFAVGEKQVPLLQADLRALVEEMKREDARFTVNNLWRNYYILEPTRCQSLEKTRTALGDIIQLVKYALGRSDKLERFSGVARQRFELWLGRKKKAGVEFSPHQKELLRKVGETVADYLTYSPAEFRVHDATLMPQCLVAGITPYISEIYNVLVA